MKLGSEIGEKGLSFCLFQTESLFLKADVEFPVIRGLYLNLLLTRLPLEIVGFQIVSSCFE